MAEHEINAKLNIDTTELDDVIEKVKQLKESLWVVNGLIEELTDANTVDIRAELSIDSKDVAQGLHNSQLAKSLKTLDARKITIGELDASRIRGTQ